MIFTLKKIVSFFIMPVSIGLILSLIALYLLFSEKTKKAKLFLTLSVIWFFLIAFAPFSNMLVKPLEEVYPKLNDVENVHYALLLGGDFQNRGYEVLRWYDKLKDLTVITSGFAGAKEISDAEEAKEKLMELGIKQNDILVQPTPKSTYEEAIEVKKIVGDEPVILVTSAIHMPRAMLIFKNQGVNVIAAPTGFLYQEKVSFYHIISAKHMLNTQQAVHEYIGILYSVMQDMYQTFKGMLK
ncbi:MAG: ElyC/SanA/YdcF family protein [Arcobacteraceae bacterium]